MSKTLIAVAVNCFLFLAYSCGGGSSSSTVPDATLSSIQSEIFNNSCSLPSCHSSGASQGNLKLNDGSSFAELVGVAADNAVAAGAGKLRVVPGNPDASFLIQKLEGPGAGEGDMMPQANDMLSQAKIDAIREWIANGAENN